MVGVGSEKVRGREGSEVEVELRSAGTVARSNRTIHLAKCA